MSGFDNKGNNKNKNSSKTFLIVNGVRPRNVGTGVLMLALTVMIILSAIFLRFNNQNMIHLRDALSDSDKSSSSAQVIRSAQKLHNYVAHHMNTNTGKIALTTLYDDAVTSLMKKAKPSNMSDDVYNPAMESCKSRLDSNGYQDWSNCIVNKIQVFGYDSSGIRSIQPPDPDLYYIDYAAPTWSFDLAGISVILSITLGSILILRIIWLATANIIIRLKNSGGNKINKG